MMLQIPRFLVLRQSQPRSRGPSASELLPRILFVAVALAASSLAANAADDGGPATAALPIDLLERAAHLQKAGQRVDELEQNAWRALSTDGDIELAVETISEAADLARAKFGDEHWLTVLKKSVASGMKSLGELTPLRRDLLFEASKGQSRAAYHASQGNRERALALNRQAQDKREQALGGDHIISVYCLLGLISNECAMEDFREGKRHAADAVRVLKSAWGEKNPGMAHALFYQAMAEAGLREFEPAEKHFRESLAILEPVAVEGCSEFYVMMHADVQLQLARLLNDLQRFADAELFARRGTEILAYAPRMTYGKYLDGQVDVARSVSGQGKMAEADIIFTCLLRSVPPNPAPETTARILTHYADHLRRAHRDADAEQLDAKISKLPVRNPSLKSSGDNGSGATPAADVPAATRKN